jgi:hypothetical protein
MDNNQGISPQGSSSYIPPINNNKNINIQGNDENSS